MEFDEGEKVTVYILDDEEDYLRYIETKLEIDGVTCYGFTNAQDLAKALAKKKPDILIIDQRLDEIQTGLDVLKRLKEDEKMSNVDIILSSAVEPYNLPKGVKFLEKPYDYRLLLLYVEDIKQRRGRVNG